MGRKERKKAMAQDRSIGMSRLKDGVTAGFRVTEIKSFNMDVEVQNATTNMIEACPWTKVQVRLTHDASQTMSQKDAYAVPTVDPSKPLVMTLHTFLIPQPAIEGVPQRPRPAEKAPSSDKMRWAFIKYDTMQKILKHGGYIPRSNPAQKFPLPGVVYMEVALSGANNYPRRIGGPEIIEEKRKAIEEMTLSLDAICDLSDSTANSASDTLDMFEEHPTERETKKDKTSKK